MMIFAYALAISTPSALTETHQADIACVATLATLAERQRLGTALSDLPNVGLSGKRWAGIVGSRITEQSGQPRELIAVAMVEAAKAEFQRPSDPAKINKCALQMSEELATADLANQPLPKPVKSK